MSVQRMLAAALLTGSVAAVAQYAPSPAGYPDPAYQPGYAQPGYYADGQPVASIEVFYEPLSHYGRWIETRWGRAFKPMVPQGWRPYTIGRWEDSPEYGRTWRSDEPFGWATYHYGRWGFDDRAGWVWVPDTVWGPGWVAWRDGGDYAGWAPLPPQVSVSFGLSLGSGFDTWDYDRWYEPSWVYVPRAYAYDRPVYNVILPYQHNREFWEHTRGVTHYDRDGDHIVNRSFDHDHDRDHGRDGDRNRGHEFDHARSQVPVQPAYGQSAYGQPAYGQPAYRQPAYGQPHYRQPYYGQSSVDPRAANHGYDGRQPAPATPGSSAAAPGNIAAPYVDPRAVYASRDRFGGNLGGPGGRGGLGNAPRPDWERRREQTFQPATGGNAPPPYNRGERGRADGYAPPPVQNYGRAPVSPPPRAAVMAPPAAFVRPAAPMLQPAPAAPRPAPTPRVEPQHNRGENIRPQ